MTTVAITERQVRLDHPAGRWIVVATALGSSLAMLDATAVNVALERIGADFDADLAGLQWTVTGYSLTLASFILLGGALGDRFGRRRMFVVGVVWFALASALCGLAPNVETLVVARALQGVGGALLTPGSLAIIGASFAPDDRPRAIGAWSGFSGIAAAIGPLVGGWLVDVWSWRLIFLVNLPLAAAVAAIAWRHVPESRDPTASHRLDAPGTILGAVGLAGLTYASIAAGEQGIGPTVVGSVLLGVLGLVAFVVVEGRSPTPLVPPALFASPQFTFANLFTFVVYGAISGVFFLLALELQVVAGYSPLEAGMSMLPVTGMMLVLSSHSGAVAQRVGPKVQLSLGPVISAVGLLLTVRIGPGASYLSDVLPAVALFGLGLAVFVAPLTASVLAAVPGEHMGVASAVNNAVARAAGLLAVALLPTVAGLSGEDYRAATAFADAYRVATFVNVGLLIIGSVVAAIGMTNVAPQPTADAGIAPEARKVAHAYSCPLEGPRLETIQPARS